MIEGKDLERIFSVTKEHWGKQVNSDQFHGLFQGKEIGHRIADYVDESTTKILRDHFQVQNELDAKGKPRSRSMGDIWIKSSGIYNPVNVKAGEYGKNGQPNLVSLSKLIAAIIAREIDSYYLLIVKMEILPSTQGGSNVRKAAKVSVRPHVYLVDMLDWLDYVTFDSGPGQAMLKEKQFYIASQNGTTQPKLTLKQKLNRMIDLYHDGNRRLLQNRESKVRKISESIEAYRSDSAKNIDQSGLKLG